MTINRLIEVLSERVERSKDYGESIITGVKQSTDMSNAPAEDRLKMFIIYSTSESGDLSYATNLLVEDFGNG